jgi:transposase
MKEVKTKRKTERGCLGCRKLKEELSKTAQKLRNTAQRLQESERGHRKTKRELTKARKIIEELTARLGQHSGNSSRPPSSDPPDAPPRPQKRRSGRKRGGQPGHPGKRRELLPVEEVDEVIEYKPKHCERCHAKLPQKAQPDDPPPLRHQVFDLLEKPYEVTEHQAYGVTCDKCGELTRAEIPKEVAGSNFGPRLAALVSFLTGALQVSRRGAEEFVNDGLQIPMALGSVSNLEAEMAQALEQPYREAGDAVRDSLSKNVDETGWKVNGNRCWLWGVGTATVAFFLIHTSRGSKALLDLMGGALKGTFTSDRWSAYGKLLSVLCRQLCWAHLIRDFQKLVDRGGKAARIGEEGLEIAYQLFWLWKDFKAGVISRQVLQECLRPLKKEMHELLERGQRLNAGKASTFCENLLALEPALWAFADREGVEPTNNHAERILRLGVLWRKRAFGANSDRGCRFAERILTVVQTRRLQKRRVFEYLVEALSAHRARKPYPSLANA